MNRPPANSFSTRLGFDRRTPCVSALANLARHTSRDTVLIASVTPGVGTAGESGEGRFTSEDVDGLSTVVHELGARHLDLVLHGSGSGLGAASDLVSLLRGRYDSIRALVPETALSIMTLIALVCDTVITPETALLGASEDPHEEHISSARAADWLARHCTQPDLSQRIELAKLMFSEEESSRSPITASHARDLGLRIHLVGDRSGIGLDLEALGHPIGDAFRNDTLIKIIENHRGAFYTVEA
jgi:hypothetical protein